MTTKKKSYLPLLEYPDGGGEPSVRLVEQKRTRAHYELKKDVAERQNWTRDWHFIWLHGLFNPLEDAIPYGHAWERDLAPSKDWVALFNYINSPTAKEVGSALTQLLLDPIVVQKVWKMPEQFIEGAWAVKMRAVSVPGAKGVHCWYDAYPVDEALARSLNFARMKK